MFSTVAETATLVHGYTLAEIDRCKHTAVRKNPSTVISAQDQHEIAWFAIIDELYRATTRPEWWELVGAGINGLQRATRQELKHRGMNEAGRGAGLRPRFLAYWADSIEAMDPDAVNPDRPRGGKAMQGVKNDFTDHLVEKLALPQVLAVLTGEEYQVIADLAAHGSRRAVLAATLIAPHVFDTRLKAARQKIVQAWLEPDTPRQPIKRADLDTVCQYGHPRADHSHKNARGLWECRKCIAQRDRRIRARGDRPYRGKHDPLEVVETTEPLTFAPPRVIDAEHPATGADVCWCGLAFGHDWPGKTAGGPHPAVAAA